MKIKNVLLTTIAAGLIAVPAANATLLYGLTSANELISFDSSNLGAVTTIGTISAGGIVDIDFSAVNNTLYGSNSAGNLFKINLTSALATLVATPDTNISNVTDIDFNPAADRLRVFSDNDRNFRMVPDATAVSAPQAVGIAGAVTNDGSFSNLTVNLVGSAYTNPIDNAATTTLYSIDSVSNSLQIHSGAPQFSTIVAVNSLGVDVGTNVGFDIDQNNAAFMSDGANLYNVNLASGGATLLGTVNKSTLVSIAAAPNALTPVPEPGSALTGLSVLGVLLGSKLRRRRPITT